MNGPPSLLDDSDEDDIDAGPAKKSRPSNQGYFAGLPQPVKSRDIDQTSRLKTIQIIDNEEVTHEDSDIVSCSNTIYLLCNASYTQSGLIRNDAKSH